MDYRQQAAFQRTGYSQHMDAQLPAADTLQWGLNDTSWSLEQRKSNITSPFGFPVPLEAEGKLAEFDQEWFI